MADSEAASPCSLAHCAFDTRREYCQVCEGEAMTALPDIYKTASLLNGVPVCTFDPAPYHRTITSILVGNSVASAVTVYRQQIGSIPVAHNTTGQNNTIRGRLMLPAGQLLFVVWNAVGPDVSDAFARVSWERTDNPLGESSTSASWDTVDLTTFAIPTNASPGVPGEVMVSGPDVPSELQAFYAAAFDTTGVASAHIWYTDLRNAYYYLATLLPYGNPAFGYVVTTDVQPVKESWRLSDGGSDFQVGFLGFTSPSMVIGKTGGGGSSKLTIQSAGGLALASDGVGGLAPFTMYTGTSVVEQGRGRVALFGPSSLDSGNAGVAEALMVTLPTFSAVQGRAYQMVVDASVFTSVAGAFCFLNLRKDIGGGILPGTNLGGWGDFNGNGAQVFPFHRAPIYRRTAATGNVSLGITGLTSAGTAKFAGLTYPYFVEMKDIGLAADYPGAVLIP